MIQIYLAYTQRKEIVLKKFWKSAGAGSFMLPAQTAKLLNPEAFSGHQRFSLAGNRVAQRRHVFLYISVFNITVEAKIGKLTKNP